jgi:hypothetical protein
MEFRDVVLVPMQGMDKFAPCKSVCRLRCPYRCSFQWSLLGQFLLPPLDNHQRRGQLSGNINIPPPHLFNVPDKSGNMENGKLGWTLSQNSYQTLGSSYISVVIYKTLLTTYFKTNTHHYKICIDFSSTLCTVFCFIVISSKLDPFHF